MTRNPLDTVALHQILAGCPHKNPGKPVMGRYQVNDTRGCACLLANMGLQLNISFSSASLNKTVQDVVNLDPNVTMSSGSCGADNAILRLSANDNKTNLTFTFTVNTTSNKYHVSEISLSAAWPDMKEPFSAHNATLNHLCGTVGYSYMCRKEQTLSVVPELAINTFEVQVQPFNLTQDQFATAEECQLDKDDMLIAIVVGAALAGLVVIVLVAYLIGRRKSHSGYQTI
ncbi:lysosome-associated membrane glycoprotein 1b isoform X2 [Dunckerocampus dactyliophorus]|uniref:lysosome-associated membrane glycoprotein 1b isoform X2 n=1 Tax=Dunckerocampus dactyliophorus TaxID=161453 RepID=UPI0024056662|nr:lysosome-associated membrane glycoprotein 1b isoform X2 [Dunckerocampus dactyliophorus]